jgi:glycosyltransferase involved in cell wall biosynthesis
MMERGHEVHVVALSDTKPAPKSIMGVALALYGVNVTARSRLSLLFSWRGLLGVARHVRAFDIVHIHAGRDIWPLAIMVLLRVLRVPYVVQSHGMLVDKGGRMMRVFDGILTRTSLAGSTLVYYLTPYERRQIEGQFPGLTYQHLVNGVDAPLDHRDPSSDEGLRVVFVSRLHPRKNAIDLARAVADLRSEGIDVEATFFGPDEGSAPALVDFIAESGRAEAIRYSGAIPYSEVRDALSAFNVFVLPSIEEPFPNSLLEAMASGLAVVCTKSCGLAPYIEEAKAGLVVEPGQRSIAQALRQLASDSSMRERLAERALQLAKERFSMASVGDVLERTYQRSIWGDGR